MYRWFRANPECIFPEMPVLTPGHETWTGHCSLMCPGSLASFKKVAWWTPRVSQGPLRAWMTPCTPAGGRVRYLVGWCTGTGSGTVPPLLYHSWYHCAAMPGTTMQPCRYHDAAMPVPRRSHASMRLRSNSSKKHRWGFAVNHQKTWMRLRSKISRTWMRLRSKTSKNTDEASQ